MESTLENWGTILLKITEEGIRDVATTEEDACVFLVGQQRYRLTREMARKIMEDRWMIPFPIRWKMGI
jgi:hypothetical protein